MSKHVPQSVQKEDGRAAQDRLIRADLIAPFVLGPPLVDQTALKGNSAELLAGRLLKPEVERTNPLQLPSRDFVPMVREVVYAESICRSSIGKDGTDVFAACAGPLEVGEAEVPADLLARLDEKSPHSSHA